MSLPEGVATTRPVIVQGSTAPVFRGPSGKVLRCDGCAHVLVDGYDPRSLIGVNIECFKCKAITRTDSWPNGEPLPTTLVTLGDAGRFLIKGTVDLKERAAMSCDQEIARVRTGTSPRPQSDANWELSPDSLMVLETELDILTDGAISRHSPAQMKARGTERPNPALERTAGSHALTAAAHRERSADKAAVGKRENIRSLMNRRQL